MMVVRVRSLLLFVCREIMMMRGDDKRDIKWWFKRGDGCSEECCCLGC